jgi:hypothetical protein
LRQDREGEEGQSGNPERKANESALHIVTGPTLKNELRIGQ